MTSEVSIKKSFKVCKLGQPVVRCQYVFDGYNVFDLGGGRLDFCLVTGSCSAAGVENRTVLCQRRPRLEASASEADLAVARAEHAETLVQLRALKVTRYPAQLQLSRTAFLHEVEAHEKTK